MNTDTASSLPEEQMPLQDVFRKLEEIIEQMEQGNAGLEESFRAYQEGMKLVSYAHSTIDGIEKKLITLEEEAGSPV